MVETPMRKPFITILQYLFFLALGVFFVWLAVKDISDQDWVDIKSSLQGARHWLIIPVVIMILLSHYSRAVRWKILMEPLGYHPSVFNTWAAVMIGYMVNAGVPRLGEVVKCTMLAKYEKVRADKLVGTIVVERALDVVCLLIVFIFALLMQGHVIGEYITHLFGQFIKDKSGHISLSKIAFIVAIGLFLLLLLYFFLKRFGHIDAVSKIKNFITGIGHGLASIKFIKRKGLFIFHTVFMWALYLFSTTLGLYALQDTDHLGVLGGLTTLAIGSIGMIITPGGIGAYPLLVAKLMESYGLPAETTGMALGWLLWTVQTLIILAGGLVFAALLSHHNNRRNRPVTAGN